MPVLVTAIYGRHRWLMRCFYVAIMTNRPNDIARRAWEHREGLYDGFGPPVEKARAE